MNGKLRILYVLTSSERDVYLEQAYVSMCSVRHYNPTAHITLLIDQITAESFVGVRKQEIRYADEVVVVGLPRELDGQRRSRMLKTSARKHVKGDFLFIDCDTIVVQPLDDILDVDAEIAACYDSHCVDFKESPYYKGNVSMGLKLNMPEIVDEEHYFNSGVILVRDTELAHRFYEAWNANLLAGVEKGVFMDQPSFAKTDFQLGHVIKRLDDVWNVELKYGMRYLRDAKVIHYLCTNRSKNQERQFFIMNDMDVLSSIKKEAVIPQEIIDTIGNPFNGLSPVCHCFAGGDIYFFTTRTFAFARELYDSRFFSFIEWSVGKCYGLCGRLSKFCKPLTKVNNGGCLSHKH